MVALYVHFTWCIKCRCVANACPINNYIVYLIIWIILIPYTKMEFFSISRRLAQCPTKACTLLSIPRKQSSWGQYGAHLGPVGPRLMPRLVLYTLCFNEVERKLKGGMLVSTCPSVRLSVRPSLDDRVCSVFSTIIVGFFHIYAAYRATSEGVSWIKCFAKFDNLTIWHFLNL